MLRRGQFLWSLIAFISIVWMASTSQSTQSNESIKTDRLNSNVSNVRITKNIASLPLAFTLNQGQWDEKVLFRANAGGATMWFAPDGAYYQFTRRIGSKDNGPYSLVDKRSRMAPDLMDREPDSIETMMIKAAFVGANPNPQMVGVDMLEYKCNYFIGNDPMEWHTDVPNYSAVMYEEIYDGISLKYYGNGNQMEYDFIVSPGADLSQITIQYEGAESIDINAYGDLVITTRWGEMVEKRPVLYQTENNNRIPVDGEYLIQSDNSFGFKVNDYNPAIPLVIDPVLSYSTYLGGEFADTGGDIAVDASGAAYVTGLTNSSAFPTLNPYQGTNKGFPDIFVTKLSSSGNSLVYSTYLGGSEGDEPNSIAVDASGAVYVTGTTGSTDFPTLNPYQGTHQGGSFDAFVTKLSSSGNSLVYSTYLGGKFWDMGHSIAVDASGAAYVTGQTESVNFPTLNPYQGTYGGSKDAFVTKLSSLGNSLVYSTYLGGGDTDIGNAIAVDASGAAYVTGWTESIDFPTLNPFQGTRGLNWKDAFVTKISSSGNSLVYSTYLGGYGEDVGNDIAVDASGAAYVTGRTDAPDFPTLNAYQQYTPGGINDDVFVTKLSSSGTGLVYSTYLGGGADDVGNGIAVDASGAAYVTGTTRSVNFPTLNPYQGSYGGSIDAFVTKLSSLGNSLVYSTYLGGGNGSDLASGIAVDASGAAYVTGKTQSTDFPVLNPYQGTRQSSLDAFVTKFNAIATDIEEFDFDNLPIDYKLSQNYPNPFNPSTTIEFTLPKTSRVTVNIYNLLGQQIQQLVNQVFSAGSYKLTWNGNTSEGVQASTGIYFYRIETEHFVEAKKMLLLK